MKNHNKFHSIALILFFFTAFTLGGFFHITIGHAATLKPYAAPTPSNIIVGNKIFDIKSKDNMQGLAYGKGYYYVSFDVGNGYSKIRKYTTSGTLVQEFPPLLLGHSAEMDFRDKNGELYVTNGSGTAPTKVYEVKINAPKPYISKSLDLSSLGKASLIAVDNSNDTLIVHTAGSNTAPPTFNVVDFNGKVIKRFKSDYQGVPQGLEVHKGIIYFYTNNKITMINFNGQIMGQSTISQVGESEGLTIREDGTNTYLVYGYNKTNRLIESNITDFHKSTYILKK